MGFKSMSIRFTDEEATGLEILSLTEGVSMAEVVRRAVGDRVATKLSDPDIWHQAHSALEERRQQSSRLLQRLQPKARPENDAYDQESVA